MEEPDRMSSNVEGRIRDKEKVPRVILKFWRQKNCKEEKLWWFKVIWELLNIYLVALELNYFLEK